MNVYAVEQYIETDGDKWGKWGNWYQCRRIEANSTREAFDKAWPDLAKQRDEEHKVVAVPKGYRLRLL